MRLRGLAGALMGFALLGVAPAHAQAVAPPEHRRDWPPLIGSDEDPATAIDAAPQLERGRPPAALLDQHRRLARALDALAPQRHGIVDAYVLAVALDSDAVFAREAREAGRVLARRYDANGRTLTLAGATGRDPDDLPHGSLATLAVALARVAERMDPREDVLVLYLTAHGARAGIAYHDGDQGYGLLSPARLAAMLDGLGIRRRLVMLSACYSGVFVPLLASPDTVLLTAASSERTSFGCRADNDWTFFGDALVNHALRRPQPFEGAATEARDSISRWEIAARLPPSDPQLSIGADAAGWLARLEARLPATATAPVGAPATAALDR